MCDEPMNTVYGQAPLVTGTRLADACCDRRSTVLLNRLCVLRYPNGGSTPYRKNKKHRLSFRCYSFHIHEGHRVALFFSFQSQFVGEV